MKFTREEIAKALKLYVITDRSWLKEDEIFLYVKKLFRTEQPFFSSAKKN